MENGIPSFSHNCSTQSSFVQLKVENPSKNNESARNTDKNNNDFDSGIEEMNLPMKNVIRIARRVLPSNGKISNDAKKSIQLCASEFMGIITYEANERCKSENRKVVTADDLVWAMNMLGFEDYGRLLAIFLKNYRDHQTRFGSIPIAYEFNKDGSGASGSSSGNGQR